MRILAVVIVVTSCGLLCCCVDPAHSRFANKGPCEVSVGSHMCTNGDDEGHALTANGDAALRQYPGSFTGGGGH